MSNLLAAVIPKLLAQGLLALRQAAFMPQIVNHSYEVLAGQKGSSIDVPIPSAIPATDVVPAITAPTATDMGPTSVSIPMSSWKEAAFYLNDQQMLQAMNGIIPMQASEAIKSLANLVNSDLLKLGIKFYGVEGTAGTTPFSPASQSQTSGNLTDTRDATNLGLVLNTQLAPFDDRHVVMDPFAQANALNIRAFQDTSWSGDPAAIRDGKLNSKLGFQWWMHQLVQTFVTGSAATITLATNAALGDGNAYVNGGIQTAGSTPNGTAINLKAASGSTLNEGDILTFAGDTQTYVVTANVTGLNGSTTTPVYIYPGLQVAQPGATATPVAVTKLATHKMNLAFHRDAIAFATRPLESTPNGLGVITESVVDEQSGLSLRLEITRQYKQLRFSYDILYGCAVVRRELGARMLG